MRWSASATVPAAQPRRLPSPDSDPNPPSATTCRRGTPAPRRPPAAALALVLKWPTLSHSLQVTLSPSLSLSTSLPLPSLALPHEPMMPSYAIIQRGRKGERRLWAARAGQRRQRTAVIYMYNTYQYKNTSQYGKSRLNTNKHVLYLLRLQYKLEISIQTMQT